MSFPFDCLKRLNGYEDIKELWIECIQMLYKPPLVTNVGAINVMNVLERNYDSIMELRNAYNNVINRFYKVRSLTDVLFRIEEIVRIIDLALPERKDEYTEYDDKQSSPTGMNIRSGMNIQFPTRSTHTGMKRITNPKQIKRMYGLH